MNERQAKILEHVVIDYVRTVTPVGSGRLAKRLGFSPATIRNEMYELAQEGYLGKPHTSAGRVPTDRGYRYFVDYMLDEYRRAGERHVAVMESLEPIRGMLDRLFRDLSRRMSDWTGCLSFISVQEEDKSEIRKLELTAVSARTLLIILVLSNGMVENKLAEMPVDPDRLPLERITRALNNRLSGMKVCDVTPGVLESLFNDIRLGEERLDDVLAGFFREIVMTFGRRMYIEGPMKLMDHPEFREPGRLRPVLGVVDSAGDDSDLFNLPPGSSGPFITIGGEHGIAELFECSSIKANFRFGDRTVGTLGILGPKRMEYSGLYDLVEYTSRSLGKMLEKFSYA